MVLIVGLTHFLELTVLKELLVLDYQGFTEITFFQKMLFLTLFGQNRKSLINKVKLLCF